MSVYKVLKAWYMQQAYLLLPARLLFWQERLGLVYNKLKITDPKQQWGCCDTQNNIRINWRIMLTGWDLIDYLLVHELCHVRHKNHSARYWKLVTSVLPNCSALRRSLRAHPAAYLHPPRPVEESFTSPSPLVSSLNDHTMFAVLG
jgi:predicted metal-dependent hydrolase